MGWLIWIGIALVLAAAEVASLSPRLHHAGRRRRHRGAGCGRRPAAVGPGAGVRAWSSAAAAGLRPQVGADPLGAQGRASVGVAADIGRIGVVVETVTEYDGRIKLPGDAIWSARLAPSDDPPSSPGEPVQVVRIEGATAIVARPRQEPSS